MGDAGYLADPNRDWLHRDRDGRCPLTPAPPDALNIGGFVPLTTVDYPGELSAVVFCQGCPWSCGYCHNAHLIPRRNPDRVSWADIASLLARRVGLLDAVVFSGGEPTLQKALPAAMKEVKAMGFKVGLHTAGPYPERLYDLLPHVDWIGLDIKALPSNYPRITGAPGSGEKAWETLRLLLDTQVPLEVRTTVLNDWTANDIRPLSNRLAAFGVENHVLQRCRVYSGAPPSNRPPR